MSIVNETINGVSVDTFKDQVILEDTVSGDTIILTVDQAITLANRIIRGAKKAEQYLIAKK